MLLPLSIFGERWPSEVKITRKSIKITPKMVIFTLIFEGHVLELISNNPKISNNLLRLKIARKDS